MGYAATYTIYMREESGWVVLDPAEESNEIEALRLTSEDAAFCLRDGCGKWYSLEEDLAALSRQFPAVEFRVDATGEASAQLRVYAYYGRTRWVGPTITWAEPEWES